MCVSAVVFSCLLISSLLLTVWPATTSSDCPLPVCCHLRHRLPPASSPDFPFCLPSSLPFLEFSSCRPMTQTSPHPHPRNKNSIPLRIHQQIHSPSGWMCCRHRRAGFSLRLRVLINASWITYWDVASRARNDITSHHEFFLVVLGFRQK